MPKVKQVESDPTKKKVFEDSAGVVSIFIPITITRRESRCRIKVSSTNPIDGTQELTLLQQGLLKGFDLMDALNSGRVENIGQLAKQENMDHSYVSRLLNMTTLSPEIVDSILTGTISEKASVPALAINVPYLWPEQIARINAL